MENKNEGNENKRILGEFKCTIDKMERDGRNKTLYRCRFNCVLPKHITDNGLQELWRREDADSSEFTRCNRSSGTRSRTDRVYTDIKIASNTKINHIMVSFTDHYNAIFIDRFPSKTKIGKDSWYFNNPFLCKPEFFLTTKTFIFLLKTQNTTTPQQVTGGKTLNPVLKKMLELFLKIQGNIRISILKRLESLYKKKTSNQKLNR